MAKKLNRIASFRVDHTKLKPGLYVSRQDEFKGIAITTFDLRLTCPNTEPPLDQAGLHTIEHLGATFLRNSRAKDRIVYFGPMGCRTGFYLLIYGEKTAKQVRPLITEMLEFICNFNGVIPGTTPEECGNYREHNLNLAKRYAANYLCDLTGNFEHEYTYLPDED